MPPAIIPSPSDSSRSVTDTALEEPRVEPSPKQTKIATRKVPNRRTLSCLPCRQHKLRCDRRVPCHTCRRYRREDECRQHPAPSALLGTAVSSPAKIAPVPSRSTVGVGQQDLRSEHVKSISSMRQRSADAETRGLQVARFLEQHRQKATFDPVNPFSDHYSQYPFPFFLPLQTFPFYTTSQPLRPGIPRDPTDTKLFWKSHLAALLPSQNQCDLLTYYYIENIDWLYHAIHIPSFRRQYSTFWSGTVDEIDLIWLSLLFTVISIAALMIPASLVEAMGFEHSTIRNLARVWHQASRQSLQAGEFESKPSVMQLQVFLATQLYWLETKSIEALNSALGQAVRNAQALGLDKNLPGANCLDTELRRRVWWDLCVADTFQSMCLDRTPLIHTPAAKVPLPLNCNDLDISETSATPHPKETPTDMSAGIARAEAFRIFRKIYVSDGAYLHSYEYIRSIDAEIECLIAQFPWYFQLSSSNNSHPNNWIAALDTIAWQHESLQISICLQRIRMNRPFLHARIGESWSVCAKAAQEMLAPYRRMREADVDKFRRSQKFLIQGYQAYTAAVTLAAFLLVERSFPGFSAESMRRDIEMVISDLEFRGGLGPLIADGVKILRQMLDMFERREREEERDADLQARETLVHDIAAVFGGEHPTRKYLKQCRIGYVLNGSMDTHVMREEGQAFGVDQQDGQGADRELVTETSVTDAVDGQMEYMSEDFDLALDMLNSDQWWDFLLQDFTFPTQ